MDIEKQKALSVPFDRMFATLVKTMREVDLLDDDANPDPEIASRATIMYLYARSEGETVDEAIEYAVAGVTGAAFVENMKDCEERVRKAEEMLERFRRAGTYEAKMGALSATVRQMKAKQERIKAILAARGVVP